VIPYIPNPEQQACIDTTEGNRVVISGPGSGKTATLLRGYQNTLMKGVHQKDILNLTFTNAAASEMVSRIGLLGAENVFRTFHSYAIDLLKRERQYLPFKVCDTIIPVYGEDFQLYKDLLKTYPAITSFRSLRDRIAEWKCSCIEPEQALQEAYHQGADFFYACAFRDYERIMRSQGWLDFDGCIVEAVKLLETNPDVRERNKKRYLAVDEGQDCDARQFKLLQLIYDGNIVIYGDENQCQPPGTLVTAIRKLKSVHGDAVIEQVPIERLKSTDRLVSWDRHIKGIRYGIGRKFKRASRYFQGELLTIHSNGNKTKVTPNHFIWTKFNKEKLKTRTHFVYLMWKKQLGFRVGTSSLRTASGSNQISHRGYQEKAEKMWILNLVKSRSEAHTLEEIYSLTYRIPESLFHPYEGCSKSKEQISRIFQAADPEGGFKLLKDRGLLFESPLVAWKKRRKHLTKFHGYFKTAAANLLPEIMDLPTDVIYISALIDKIEKEPYAGPVYSLDVERDHTYVADNIPVGNCIFEWRSARPNNLTNFNQKFPNSKTLYLGQNFRSTKKIVAFLKKIIPVDNGLGSHMFSNREEGTDVLFTKFDDDFQEASVVLSRITDPDNSAVIARTNRQLLNFQKVCLGRQIKSKILGRKNLWEQSEVAHLLRVAKTRETDLRPAHTVLAELIQTENLMFLYRNAGSPNEKSPVENLNDIVKMSAKRGTTAEFLTWLRKLTYGSKANKRKSEPVLNLMTVHASKGREFKHVYLIGVSQGLLPHKDGELLEEARILFVGASRACDTLELSFSGPRSQFLNDFQGEIVDYGQEHRQETNR